MGDPRKSIPLAGLGWRRELVRALPPHLVREVVTVPDEVRAQSAGAVPRGRGPLLRAQEEGHSLSQQRGGAELAQQGREQGGGGEDALLRPRRREHGARWGRGGQTNREWTRVGVAEHLSGYILWLVSPCSFPSTLRSWGPRGRPFASSQQL